jgi:hypothetical protein
MPEPRRVKITGVIGGTLAGNPRDGTGHQPSHRPAP